MANKTITQLDAAESLVWNMAIPVELNGNTYKASLGSIKTYCQPTGTINITTNGTYNVADYAEAVVNVPVPAGDKYKVGDRVVDDYDYPVGTVSSIFTDGSNNRYAVVCLDAQFRLSSGQYLSSDTLVSEIPQYANQLVWSAPETATTNTTAILATGTSTACTHCRTQSFTIDSVTYEGQLPNLNELSQIFAKRTLINTQDPSASTYSSLIIPSSSTAWSSTQREIVTAWAVTQYGSTAGNNNKNIGNFVIPVLEIPL